MTPPSSNPRRRRNASSAPKIPKALRSGAFAFAAVLLSGCIVTAPVKVVGKTAKVGAKTVAAGAKAGASLVTPDHKDETEDER